MLSSVDNSIKPMYGGNVLTFNAGLTPSVEINYNTTTNWAGALDEIEDLKHSTLNFYYKINGRNGDNSFVVSTGVYIDVTWSTDFQSSVDVPNQTDVEPFYVWLKIPNGTRITISDANSSQQNIISFGGFGNGTGVPGIMLNSTMVKSPTQALPNRYVYTANYRFWLGSNLDFVLTPAAKLNFVSNFGATQSVADSLYLHFDNIPYISYPTEINDVTDFVIDYSFPNLSKLEYIQFSLLDELDNPVIEYRNIPKTSNTYTFSLTSEDKDRLYARFNTVNDTPLAFGVKFKNYSEQPTLMSHTVHFTIVKVDPEIYVTLTDDNHIVNAEEVFVNLLSDLHVHVTPVAFKGASIVQYGIEHNGEAVLNQTDAVFPSVTYQRLSVFCEDSRGNKISKHMALDGWIPYQPPTCTISAEAPNTDGELPITLSGKYFGDYYAFDNEYEIYYKWTSSNKNNSVTDWTLFPNKPSITTDSSYRFTTYFDLLVPNHADTYTVQIQFRDRYRSYDSNSVTVKSSPVFDWGQEDFNFNVPVTIRGDLTVTGSITSNTPVAQVENPAADYIVDQGTITTGSGNATANWVYRKWNSGVAECWCRKHVSTAVNTAWGGLYVSGALSYTNITWGVNFVDIPVANITIAPNASGAFLIAGGSTSLTKTNTGGYEIARGAALASAGNFYINYYGVGRWK